ncbi:MAG: rod shape-determining protein RodA [Candidatus Obscuribacterales bacterium]|nr:rod shape-determining protein RodA [Candidatus Obscuribacterales bacterium]
MISEGRQSPIPGLIRAVLSLLGSVDWLLLAATGFLLYVGLLTLSHTGAGANTEFHDKQAEFLYAGTVAAIIFWRIPYRFWTNKYVLPVLYIINLGLLLAVMVAGHSALGAQRWLSLGPIKLQPSEIAKLVVIFTMASWLAWRPIKTFWDNFLCIAIIAVPAILVFKQPDLGTSLVFAAVFLGMTFWSGATVCDLLVLGSPLITLILNAVDKPLLAWIYKGVPMGTELSMTTSTPYDGYIWLGFLAFLGAFLALFWRRRQFNIFLRLFLISCILAVNFVAAEARPKLWNVLKPYQQKRLTSFVNPYSDPRGSGYHILQSLIAIGSGGVNGTGLGKGNQTQGAFIPERHTDFIFAVVGEELGFKTCILVILAYFMICIRAIIIAFQSRDEPVGSLMAIGIMCMFMFHAFLNMGMTMGIMPVAGVPLPFLSYGGTALIIDLVAIGLLLSVRTINPKPKEKDNWW